MKAFVQLKFGKTLPRRRLSPFPFAGLPVVASDTALDHFVAPLIARHDEGSEVAAAEAKGAESHHNENLQRQLVHDLVLAILYRQATGKRAKALDLDQITRLAGANSLSAFGQLGSGQWRVTQNVGSVASRPSLNSANGRDIVARQKIISKTNSI